jgi:RNA polymerase sigma-70 factor (ECF subfamily)
MDARSRDELESAIREKCTSGDLAVAADLAIRGYGAEIFGFLTAFHHDEEDAAEVWSRVSEKLWAGLDRFEWQSSFRTWLYAIARNASIRYRQEKRRGAARHVELRGNEEDGSQIGNGGGGKSGGLLGGDAFIARIRTDTASWLRTASKDRFAALRDSLPEDDRMLLVLRVDKDLAWNDLARVMSVENGDDATIDEPTLKREAARLRKRFQLVKERLLEMKRALPEESRS